MIPTYLETAGGPSHIKALAFVERRKPVDAECRMLLLENSTSGLRWCESEKQKQDCFGHRERQDRAE